MIEIRDIPGGRVTEPGLYRMTAEQYHADPAPKPSLSSGAIRKMLERTPRHAYCEHPRLGGQRDETSKPVFTLGTVAHALILGAGREFVVIEADSFRTKAAQEQRDAATAAGLTPIIREQYDRARAMAASAARELESLPLVGDALVSGRPEIVAIWREKVGVEECEGCGGHGLVGNILDTNTCRFCNGSGEQDSYIWCRSMMDLCPTAIDADGWWTIYDLKTTQMALDPNTIARHLVSNGYDVQAAFYCRGLESLLGPAARVRFRFLFVESDAPHLCAAFVGSGEMQTTGEQKVMAGISIWQRCIATNNWPGYSTEVLRLEPPKFMETLWADREAGDPLIAGALNNWSKAA